MKTPLLSIKNLTTRFDNRVVHNNISIDFLKNQLTLVMGSSGSGKSTLMDFIVSPEDRECYDGELYWLGKQWDRSDIAHKIGYAPQTGGFLLDQTIPENISMPLRYVWGMDNKTSLEIAWAYMQLVDLKPEVFSMYPNMLSGGMLRRASIARSLVLDQEVIIMDEPFSGLDPINCKLLIQLIKRILKNKTVIIISHHIINADKYVLLLNDECIQGSLEEVKQNEIAKEFIQSFDEI